MAFVKGTTTELKYSVSAIPGNLDAASFRIASSSEGNVAYIVIHKNIVNIAFITSGVCTQEQAPFDDKNSCTTITQVTVVSWYMIYIYFPSIDRPNGAFSETEEMSLC